VRRTGASVLASSAIAPASVAAALFALAGRCTNVRSVACVASICTGVEKLRDVEHLHRVDIGHR